MGTARSKQSEEIVSEEEEPLPPGWKQATTNEGKIYYYHEITGETIWTRPTKPATIAIPPPPPPPPPPPEEESLPEGWRQFRLPDGKIYYYNERTRESTWTRPSHTTLTTTTTPPPQPPTQSQPQQQPQLRQSNTRSDRPVKCNKKKNKNNANDNHANRSVACPAPAPAPAPPSAPTNEVLDDLQRAAYTGMIAGVHFGVRRTISQKIVKAMK